jgi:hypothetical protein
MKKLFSSFKSYLYTLGAITVMFGSTFGIMPAKAEAVATIGADMEDDARLVGKIIEDVGSDAKADLIILSDAFFETFENIGAGVVGGSVLMASDITLVSIHTFDGAIDGALAVGESLAVAGDSFFDGFSSMGSSLALAGEMFFDGSAYVGSGLAFVGERIDGAIFGETSSKMAKAFPVSGPREVPQDNFVATPIIPAAPTGPVAIEPQAEPVSAVAGLKVVGNNLVLNDSEEADASEPADFSFYLGSGKANLANQNYVAAIADFEQAIRLNPSALNAYQQLAFAHQSQGNINSAIATIEIGLSQGGRSNADYLLQVGKLYFKRHTAEDLVVAERAFREVLALNPQSTEAIFALGAVAEAKDNVATQ